MPMTPAWEPDQRQIKDYEGDLKDIEFLMWFEGNFSLVILKVTLFSVVVV